VTPLVGVRLTHLRSVQKNEPHPPIFLIFSLHENSVMLSLKTISVFSLA